MTDEPMTLERAESLLVLTQQQVADLLQLDPRTVRDLRDELRPTYVGRLPRYYLADVKAYLRRRRERVA